MCNRTVLDKITVENKKLPVKYKFHRREQYYFAFPFCVCYKTVCTKEFAIKRFKMFHYILEI
jgi:hypothetical protein